MNETIIRGINNKVPEDGILFNLGDMLFGDKTQIEYWLSRINCKTHIYIYGNHCDKIRKNREYQDLFTWCGDYLEIFVGKKLVCMSHYAMRVWNASHKGSFMFFGHSHGSLQGIGRQIDVGIDNAYKILGKYEPFSYNEVDSLLKDIPVNHPDHHNQDTNWK